MKSILLLDTSVGSLNQGDEIINVSIKNNWPELYRGNYVMRLATHTPVYSPMQQLLYKKKLSVFRNADIKFLCGTNAVYTNMLRPLPTWNINLLDCGLLSGTVCLGAGIGKNSKNINLYTKMLYNKTLSHDYIHSTRDEVTKEMLLGLGFKAINTGCPTLWGLNSDHCKDIPNEKAANVVFTLTYYESDRKNDTEMIRILRENYKRLFFWPQCFKDLEYLNSLGEHSDIEVISPNLEAYDRLLSDEDVDYVGNRLHGGIFALQHKRRAVIAAIDYRAIEMNKRYSFVCIERKAIPDELCNLINTKWKTEILGLDFELIETWKKQFTDE